MTGNLFADTPANSNTNAAFTAHCDGGSRGNPGPSGYGAVVEDVGGRTVARLSEFLGVQTNNYAEYSGLLAVLRWAIENNVQRLTVVSDSELMVKQMQGKYSVKSPVLRPLYDEAKKLARRVPGFEMRHTLRAGNKEADQLANDAMDRGMGKTPITATSGVSAVSGVSRTPAPRAAAQPATKAERQVLEGYVKNGVVHLLEGQLPEGVFVKVMRE